MSLSRTEDFGPRVMYVRVYLNTGKKYSHIAHELLAEAIFHETIHAIKGDGPSENYLVSGL